MFSRKSKTLEAKVKAPVFKDEIMSVWEKNGKPFVVCVITLELDPDDLGSYNSKTIQSASCEYIKRSYLAKGLVEKLREYNYEKEKDKQPSEPKPTQADMTMLTRPKTLLERGKTYMSDRKNKTPDIKVEISEISSVHEINEKPVIFCPITLTFDPDALDNCNSNKVQNALKHINYLEWSEVIVCKIGEYTKVRTEARLKAMEEEKEKKEREKEKRRKDEQDHLKLTNEYCQKNREIDGYRDWDAYRRCFNEIAPFLQLLLGAERRYAQEGSISETNLRTALQLSVQNAGLDRKLTAGGFQVAQVPSEYDEEALRRSCEKVNNDTIQEENDKLERRLRDYRRSLDYKQIIQGSESILYTILQDIQRGDIQSFLKHDERHDERIDRLKGVLEAHNCHAIYWNDDQVKESEAMRATFQEDSPYATELPGFFIETDGRYDRIGILGGTMREICTPESTQ